MNFQNNTFRIHSQANWQAWLFRSTFFLKKRNNNISKCAQFVGSMCVLFCFLSLSLMLFCFIQIVRVPSHSTTTPPKHKTTNRFSQLKSTIDLKQKTKNEGFCLFKDFFFLLWINKFSKKKKKSKSKNCSGFRWERKKDLKFVTIEPEQTKGASQPRVAAYVDNVVDMIGVYLRVWRTHEASISSVSSAVGFRF